MASGFMSLTRLDQTLIDQRIDRLGETLVLPVRILCGRVAL